MEEMLSIRRMKVSMPACPHLFKPSRFPACLIACLIVCHSLCAQAPTTLQSIDALSAPPRQVAQEAIKNEIKLIEYDHSFLRYKVHTRDNKGEQVRDVIETPDGTVARVTRRESRPLTPEENAFEHDRLQTMIDSPTVFRKHIDKDKTGKKLAIDLINLLPDAMIFSYVADQPQREHKPAQTAPELVIDFAPDPKWNPPTMTSQALTGVKGRVWIDAETHHLTRLDAHHLPGRQLRLRHAGSHLSRRQALPRAAASPAPTAGSSTTSSSRSHSAPCSSKP